MGLRDYYLGVTKFILGVINVNGPKEFLRSLLAVDELSFRDLWDTANNLTYVFLKYQDKKMTVEYSKCWVMVIVSFISVAVTTACFESLQVFTGDSPWGRAAFSSLACPCWWRPYWHFWQSGNSLLPCHTISKYSAPTTYSHCLDHLRFTHISCAYSLGVVMTSRNLFLDLRVGN